MTSRRLTEFLNVDLDFACSKRLDEIIGAMDGLVLVMHRTSTEASVELREQPDSADGAIAMFVQLLQQLPKTARAAWDDCQNRTFNIGIQARSEPQSISFPLSQQTISGVMRVGANIAFTVYGTPTAKPRSRPRDADRPL